MTTQPDLFLSSPAPAQRHSRTSLDAAKAIEPGAGTDRLKVLMYLRDQGQRGATDEQIQDALGLAGSSERPRRVELLEAGLIWQSIETRATRSGRQATIWRA
jgi:hypothetical protein